jgi:hypothetical protein
MTPILLLFPCDIEAAERAAKRMNVEIWPESRNPGWWRTIGAERVACDICKQPAWLSPDQMKLAASLEVKHRICFGCALDVGMSPSTPMIEVGRMVPQWAVTRES